MKVKYSDKFLGCLMLAFVGHRKDITDEERYCEWSALYEALCVKYSAKAIDRKMEEMNQRGYLEGGVSVRTSWLTDKGRAVLTADLVKEVPKPQAPVHQEAPGDSL